VYGFVVCDSHSIVVTHGHLVAVSNAYGFVVCDSHSIVVTHGHLIAVSNAYGFVVCDSLGVSVPHKHDDFDVHKYRYNHAVLYRIPRTVSGVHFKVKRGINIAGSLAHVCSFAVTSSVHEAGNCVAVKAVIYAVARSSVYNVSTCE